MKPPLLFLSHRIPYPPNKGDKIRSWNLLRYLAEHYRVYLGTFVDDPDDWQHVSVLEALCADCCILGLNPYLGRLDSLSAFLTGDALSLPYYRSRRLRQWVNRTIDAQGVRHAVVYSSPMAQYVIDPALGLQRRVIDFVDIDSDKWRQYAGNHGGPMRWLYRREAELLFRYEKRVAASFDASLFVSAAEAELFRRMAPGLAGRVAYYNNGVDTGYFQPSPDCPSPYPAGIEPIVFTGAMDYWPNVDAVCWFAREVLPLIRSERPAAHFCIVGSRPSTEVRALSSDAVTVTGRVDDVRPYLQHALAAVAPMRVARGIQNKVLEAMAMQKPVVVSTPGLEGIGAQVGAELLLADSPREMARQLIDACSGHYPEMGIEARRRVQQDFVWEHNLPLVHRLLQGGKVETA